MTNFTAPRTFASCMGASHSHAPALITVCPTCGADVVTYHGRTLDAKRMGRLDGRRFACWSKAHECVMGTPADRERYADLVVLIKAAENMAASVPAMAEVVMAGAASLIAERDALAITLGL